MAKAVTKPRRFQRKRVKGWRKPAGAVIISRPGFWGNPFKGPKALHLYRLLWRRRWKDLERAGVSVIGIFRLQALLSEWTRRLPELRNKDLVCWCRLSDECHGDILLARANEKENR